MVLLCRKLKPFSQYATTWSATQTSHPGPLQENPIWKPTGKVVLFVVFFGGYINDDYINVYKSRGCKFNQPCILIHIQIQVDHVTLQLVIASARDKRHYGKTSPAPILYNLGAWSGVEGGYMARLCSSWEGMTVWPSNAPQYRHISCLDERIWWAFEHVEVLAVTKQL